MKTFSPDVERTKENVNKMKTFSPDINIIDKKSKNSLNKNINSLNQVNKNAE